MTESRYECQKLYATSAECQLCDKPGADYRFDQNTHNGNTRRHLNARQYCKACYLAVIDAWPFKLGKKS